MSPVKPLIVAISLTFFATAIVQAQSSTPVSAAIGGSDMAAASSVSHSWYRLLPAATKAARSIPPGALSNKKLSSIPTLPQPGFYPADLVNHGGAVVTSADQNPVYLNCSSGPA